MKLKILAFLLIVLCLIGCSRKEVSNIYIRTTIVIDPLTHRSPCKILEDLSYAEQLYKNLDLKFNVVEVEKRYTHLEEIEIQKAGANSEILYIIYVPSILNIYGHTYYPESQINCIFINGNEAPTQTLAHEIGHYFGLRHTFENQDCVQDTPPPVKMTETEKFEFIHGNIMGRAILPDWKYTITEGQLKRMRFFASKQRRNQLMLFSYSNKDHLKCRF